MPFTDIFMTPVLLFPGGRKPGGALGAAGALPGGSGQERGAHVSPQSEQCSKSPGSHSLPALPSGTLLTVPFHRGGGGFLPRPGEGMVLARRNTLTGVGTCLQGSDSAPRAGAAALGPLLGGTDVLPTELHPALVSSAVESEVLRPVSEAVICHLLWRVDK